MVYMGQKICISNTEDAQNYQFKRLKQAQKGKGMVVREHKRPRPSSQLCGPCPLCALASRAVSSPGGECAGSSHRTSPLS